MVKGEIRWYRFSSPDKRRPVIILTRTAIIPHMSHVTVASITSTIRDIPSEVLLSSADGMPKDCVINCDQITLVPKSKIGALITPLSLKKTEELKQALRYNLSL